MPLLKALYGSDVESVVQRAWEDSLQRIRRVETVLLGIPSDTGAGIRKGANFGPLGVRLAYLDMHKSYPKGLLDLGDVLSVPHLLHDEMLNDSQIAATRAALYPGIKEPLPVSPLSVGEAALSAVHELNPQARVILIGGDHSTAWPAMRYCHTRCGDDFGVLHFDAHTDLMETRLGVKYCFATWARQALPLMRPLGMVQVGIRSSAKTKEYWMQTCPVLQVWWKEVPGNEGAVMEQVIRHFKGQKIKRIYISNDIDGTDPLFAPATGTPEIDGLHPQFVKDLIGRVRQEFELIGGDVVEVAPPLAGTLDFAGEKTCRVGAEYLHAVIS